MIRIFNLLLLLFLSTKVNAQKNNFELSTNKKQSFYDKKIVAIVNNKLKQYPRTKKDTAFVEINDFPETTFFDAFITIKSKKQLRYYYIFYNPHVDYYIVELNKNLIPIVDIINIKTLLNDTNYVKEDTTVYVYGKSSCHFYFGIHKSDKELSVWNTIFWKPHGNTLEYREITKDLYSYFSSTERRTISPAVIKKYRRVIMK